MSLDKQIILSLGTNLGNKKANLSAAINLLLDKIDIRKVSKLYGTASLLRDQQSEYYNICCLGFTKLSEQELLEFIKSVELKLGRVKADKWQSRLIDIDIIDYSHQVYHTPNLIIPHQEMEKRSFVLFPLKDIMLTYINPVSGKNIDQLIQDLGDDLDIKVIGGLKWQ